MKRVKTASTLASAALAGALIAMFGAQLRKTDAAPQAPITAKHGVVLKLNRDFHVHILGPVSNSPTITLDHNKYTFTVKLIQVSPNPHGGPNLGVRFIATPTGLKAVAAAEATKQGSAAQEKQKPKVVRPPFDGDDLTVTVNGGNPVTVNVPTASED
jgi:hypothetical protein